MPIAYTTTGRALTFNEQWATFTRAETHAPDTWPRSYGVGDWVDCGHNLDGFQTAAQAYAEGSPNGFRWGMVPPFEHMATWKWRTLIENEGVGGRTLWGNGEQQLYANLEHQRPWNTTNPRFGTLPPTHERMTDPTATGGHYLKLRGHRFPAAQTGYPYYNADPLAGHKYISGMINGFRAIERQYGMWEGRFRFKAAHAIWPAFWLMPADGIQVSPGRWPPEIDIFEWIPYIHDLGQYVGSPWAGRSRFNIGILTRSTDIGGLGGFYGNDPGEFAGTQPATVGLDDNQWHHFGCLITPTKLAIYLNYVNIYECDTPESYKVSYEYPGQPRWWFPIVNIAIGSHHGDSWASRVDKDVTTPDLVELDIDWIKHWDATAAEGGPYFTGHNSNGPIVIAHGGVLTPNGTPENPGGGGAGSTGGTPVNISVGTGPKTLVLKISQDFYLQDAQYSVAVDGVQIGGVLSASARNGSGQDTLTIFGNWAPGAHTLTVTFLNDAFVAGVGDSNLIIHSATYQGSAIGGAAQTIWSAGSVDIAFTDAGDPVVAGTLVAPELGSTVNSGAAINANLKHYFIPALSRPAVQIAQLAAGGSNAPLSFGTLNIDAQFMRPYSTTGLTLAFEDDFNTDHTISGVTRPINWNSAAPIKGVTAGWDGAWPRPGYTGKWCTRIQDGVRFYPGSYEYNADPDHGQNPFSRSGSILTINARPSTDTTLTGGQTWVSGMLTTFGFFKQWYGLWEVRMRSVNSRGSLPAFWMLMGEQDAFPEIDIAEIGNGANADERLRSFWTAQHHTSSLDDTWAPTQRIFPALGSDTNIHQSFHTYSFYFDEQICVWYFDGKPVRQIPTPDKLRWAPYYLIISNSIGSDDPAWGLPPDGTTLNPTTLEIDWVRVWSIW